jgi:SAM-dependent methyltransferase
MNHGDATCPACWSEKSRRFVAREMLYGTGEEFEYAECLECLTLHLVDVPTDLSRFYPPDYLGSFDGVSDPRVARARLALQRCKTRLSLAGQSSLAGLFTRLGANYQPPGWVDFDWQWLKKTGASTDSRILEVGCGPGWLLHSLQRLGFKYITGLDTYQERVLPGLLVHRFDIENLSGQFDVIMLHHSLEHMHEPRRVLSTLVRLLDDRGTILIRIPVSGCWAWKTYGADWVQLDAPRHLVIPSIEGMRKLVAHSGLRISDIVFDSTALQLYGSEQYRRGIPLRDSRSHFVNPKGGLFSPAEIEKFDIHARQLNELGEADQAAFYLQRQ